MEEGNRYPQTQSPQLKGCLWPEADFFAASPWQAPQAHDPRTTHELPNRKRYISWLPLIAMVNFLDDIRNNINNRKLTIGTFINFQKAFDTPI